jgi:hypothetical protein
VIVQNAEQVNIAADGGQQVNVKKSKKWKNTNKGKRGKRVIKPKQLGSKSPEESIGMTPASEAVQVK